jgi:hypothetical protein
VGENTIKIGQRKATVPYKLLAFCERRHVKRKVHMINKNITH